MTLRNSYTYDHGLLLKDAGAVTADGAGTVSSVARVIDLGNGAMDGVAVVDTSALDLTSADETYRVVVQGSNVANMGSGLVELGSSVVTAASSRGEARFTNRQGGTIYRYVRVYIDVGGTTPSINCVASIRRA